MALVLREDGTAPQTPGAQPPSVSIVIPAYNEEAVIRRCLLAAVGQTVPADQIIVVDNMSTDGTAGIVREVAAEYPDSGVELISQIARQGLVPTRNAGFDHAYGDILGRIDADSILEPDWVAQVREAFTDPDVAAVTGPVRYYDMPLHRLGLAADDKIRQFLLRLAKYEYHFLFGSNMALRRSAWEAIASHTCEDESDQMHEDIDLSLHLAESRLTIKYVPTMISGMSARRLEDSLRDYGYYVTRFERTYKAHNVRKIALRAPMVVFFSVYYPAKMIRALQGTGSGRKDTPVS